MSAIDLAFASPSVVDFCQWSVLDDTHLSDHFPIMISFNFLPKKIKFFNNKIKLTKNEKDQYFFNLSSNLEVLNNNVDVPSLNAVQKYHIFTHHLEEHLPPRSAPRLTKTSSRSSKVARERFSLPALWWNDSCQCAVDLRRGLLSVFKRSPSFYNFLAFKRQEAISRRILRSEKRKSWRNFCQDLSPKSPIG